MKTILTILMILIATTTFAQGFEKINGLGKSENQIITMIKEFSFHKANGNFQGERVDSWHSPEFGLVGYIYDKNYICVKMLIPSMSKSNYDFKGYKVTKLDNCNIIVIENMKPSKN
jgi:hypothetical protein